MEIINYGIILRKITLNDMELMRTWRNSDFVKKHMVFKSYLTREMQIDWYLKINNINNYYFIIYKENKPIGITNLKDIDFSNGTAESGIFMYSEEYTNSDLGVRATFSLLDFAFLTLKLNKLRQTIIVENKAAMNFNKSLGVKITENKDGICKGELVKEDYYKKTLKIRNYINKYIS